MKKVILCLLFICLFTHAQEIENLKIKRSGGGQIEATINHFTKTDFSLTLDSCNFSREKRDISMLVTNPELVRVVNLIMTNDPSIRILNDVSPRVSLPRATGTWREVSYTIKNDFGPRENFITVKLSHPVILINGQELQGFFYKLENYARRMCNK